MTKRILLPATVLTLLATAACEDTTGPEVLDSALLLQAAVVAADATLEDIGMLGQPFAFGQEGSREGMGRPGGHRRLGGELSGTRDVTFYDAAGNVQEAYDSLTTERIVASVDVAGEVGRDGWSASISRTRDMIITGLAGPNTTRIMNGSGSEDVSHSRLTENGDTSSHHMTGTFTYTDLVVPTPDQDVRYPLSGTITRLMTVTVVNGPLGDVDRSLDVTITFDGDATATGVIDGETFEIDLTTREGRFPLSRGFGRHAGG